MIKCYEIENRKIYINEFNGHFADDYLKLKDNEYFQILGPSEYSPFLYKCINICIQISNACNMNCSYCFGNKTFNNRISITNIKKYLDMIFDYFLDAEKYFIDLSGSGEPLLHKDIIAFVSEYAKNKSDEIKKEIIVNLVTNGLLLDEKTAKFLQDNYVLFGVSIDGNEKTHDSLRKDINNNTTFNRVISNIDQIEHKDYVGCACTITNKTFDLVDSLKFFKTRFKTISYKPVRSKQFGIKGEALKQWKLEYNKLCQCLKTELRQNDLTTIKCLLNGDDYFGKFLLRTILKLKVLNRCDAGLGRLSLSNDGNIYCCPALSNYDEYKIGDLESGLNKSKLENVFYKLLNKNTKCQNCSFSFQCGGECLVELLENNGEPYPDMCEFNKHLILLAMDLSLYIESLPNLEIHKEIFEFCVEKRKRFRKDNELENFLKHNPSLSFTEGKKAYDSKALKY